MIHQLPRIKAQSLLRLCAFALMFGLVGCTQPAASPTVAPLPGGNLGLTNLAGPPSETSSPSPLPPRPTPTQLPTPTQTLTAAPTSTLQPLTGLCSPLQGIPLDELPKLIAGDTYLPPQPGRDDGHHGVDFAFYRRGSLTTILGLPVQSALAGRVAAVVNDRKPYGNMLIVETRFESLPPAWLAGLNLPERIATVQPDPRLTCPKPAQAPAWDASQRSIYTLYAHLNKTPAFQVGDSLSCGQVLGEVGTTGNSVNPHLHFETRVGPSGAVFDSLGHYDVRLSDSERANYCLWRVSGWFQLFDPMLLLSER